MCTKTTRAPETDTTPYTVVCIACGSVWNPPPQSPAWWLAKQRAEKNPNRLDASHVSSYMCGCEKKPYKPEAPFRISGYNDMCENFDIPCSTFVEAVKKFLDASRHGSIVFITGVSDRLDWKLMYGR